MADGYTPLIAKLAPAGEMEISAPAPVMEVGGTEHPAVGTGSLWISSLIVGIWPGAREVWRGARMGQAIGVGIFNMLLGAGWGWIVLVFGYRWYTGQGHMEAGKEHWRWATLRQAGDSLAKLAANQWAGTEMISKIGLMWGAAFLVMGMLVLPFFMLLPFGARPGRNRACVKHVARTVLLGTGMLHWWGLAYVLTFVGLTAYPAEPGVAWSLFVFAGMGVWTLGVMILAVRREYRGPRDMPEKHDPWCDACGYNLVAAEAAGCCPECGRLVAESLGETTRPATEWEMEPRLLNVKVIGRQVVELVRRPRELFMAMPTLSGQRAAQRWLVGSMVLVGAVAGLIVPTMGVLNASEWSLVLVSGSLAMGVVWGAMGLMMVGVETAGIATFSRMRGHGVYLSAAAKVTAYSSILMLVWVVLGGARLVAVVYWAQPEHDLRVIYHLSVRTEQIFLATSLSAAHIGGLLWYELTVYRGVRAVQFANR